MLSNFNPTTGLSKAGLLKAAALVSFNRVLLRLNVRRPIDGWRRGASLSLTNETARFVLSAFNLDVLSDTPASTASEEVATYLALRLTELLQSESQFHLCVEHDPRQDRVVPHGKPSFSLRIEPWIEGPGRFVRPDQWVGPTASPLPVKTSPVFEFVCRICPERQVDLWVRINHVAIDGVPAQEMLSRVEATWGVRGPVVFPGEAEFEPHTRPRPTPGRPGAVEVQTFVDFSRVLAWRKRENENLSEPMTLSAAILWWLAKHPTFSGLYMGTTVEVHATRGLDRGVGVLVVRPSDYFARTDGLARYVRAFNRELSLTKRRASASCKTLDAAAYLPPTLERAVLAHALNEGKRAFGSVGLTILKDAKVFGAPLGDSGHDNGFIAIGGVSLPSKDRAAVGCVVVKGPHTRIADYARIIRDAMAKAE